MVDRVAQPIEGDSGEVRLAYEHRLDQDGRWALSEGGRHFDEKSEVHQTLHRICKRLGDLGIPYAVAGAIALFMHGYRRFTEDVGILITRHDLKHLHKEVSGPGYRPLFAGSKSLRDAHSGVRIEFLITGDYPGDGREKPVAFPDPRDVSEARDNIQIVNLPTLVELKLASGMSGADRLRDLADVQDLIKFFLLPVDFVDPLNPYVQLKYREIWQATRDAGRRYVKRCRNKFQKVRARTIDEMISMLPDSAATLTSMRDDGVTLDPSAGKSDGYAYLVTTDPDVAREYDMHDESEVWSDAEIDSDEDEAT